MEVMAKVHTAMWQEPLIPTTHSNAYRWHTSTTSTHSMLHNFVLSCWAFYKTWGGHGPLEKPWPDHSSLPPCSAFPQPDESPWGNTHHPNFKRVWGDHFPGGSNWWNVWSPNCKVGSIHAPGAWVWSPCLLVGCIHPHRALLRTTQGSYARNGTNAGCNGNQCAIWGRRWYSVPQRWGGPDPRRIGTIWGWWGWWGWCSLWSVHSELFT